MPINILMPALSPTMEEGKLAKWLVKEGDAVQSGAVLAEIETDKATMEVEAVDEGTVGKILVAEGAEGVKVNTPIAILLEEGEDESAMSESGGGAESAPPPADPKPSGGQTNGAAAATPGPAQYEAAKAPEGAAPTPAAAPSAASQSASQAGSGSSDGGRVFASPLARRLAKDNNIDLSLLKGSGPHGRIVKSDIDAALKDGTGKAGSAGTAVATTGAAAASGGGMVPAMPDHQVLQLFQEGTYEVVPHDGMRKVIAQRLTQSKQTVPHFYLTLDCRLDELLRARARMNEAAPKDGPRAYKLSVNDFIIKALALGLQDVPGANASWT
ncbi:MAG: 2-oxo acid dehydrogenase subunit E2, partial [Pseudomonadota bacterium]